MSNGVRYTPTFAMPTEYERAAMEARRRQRMAEMLAQQAYTPQDIGSAPIPSAAPLVQGLQAFLTARQQRKAEEALEKAQTAETAEISDLLKRLGPQERTGAEAAIADLRDTSRMGALSPTGEYTPSQITPSTQPIGMPSVEAAPTGQARRDLLMSTMASGAPRASKLAELMLAQKEEKPELPYSKVNLAELSPESRKAFVASVEAGKPDFSLVEPIGMTPQQQRQYELDLAKFGIDQAQANLARAKAADEGIDVSGMRIPSIPSLTAAAGTARPAPAPQMPSQTPAQMRMEGFGATTPRPTGPRPAANVPIGVSTGVAPSVAPAERRRVPQIESPLVPPKIKRELILIQPETEKSVKGSLTGANRLINMADDLANHKGIEDITGPIAQYSVTDFAKNTAAANARALYDSMVSQIGLLKIQAAKDESKTGASGYGAMTREEWPRLEQSVAAIGLAQDAESLDIALRNFKREIKAMFDDTKSFYESKYGNIDWKPIEYERQSSRYPRKKPVVSETRQKARDIVYGNQN